MTKGQQRIAAILCRRDNCTFKEAESIIEYTIERMMDVEFDPLECEEIMYEELGLEPDYMFDLLM